MSHISYCNLPIKLSMLAALNDGLILAASRQISSMPTNNFGAAKRLPANLFLAQQGLYASAIANQMMYYNPCFGQSLLLETSSFGFIKNKNERPFVRVYEQLDNTELLLANVQELAELLLIQIANSDQNSDVVRWMCWTNQQGYLYFQPTASALRAWLKMLFVQTLTINQEHTLVLAAKTSCLSYVEQRCCQMRKLATIENNPWEQGSLACETIAELELIYGLIEVYDALCDKAHYKILAAGRSLVEKFLEFDRTCRLSDLAAGSPEFQARAGLIEIVRSAVRELLVRAVGG
jgi:hypothetical protein